MTAAELKNVTFSYDGFENKILKNVNFSFDYGEVTLLCGLSGEGKSTVLSLVSGIIPNVTPGNIVGNILVNGINTKGKKLSEICREVAIVLQNADSQIIQKYVEDEIAFGCENFAFKPEVISSQIEQVCKILNLKPEWKTRTLSGGQKQRLITASSLATGQKILILDEPLANLDTEGAKLLMNTLCALAKSGYAILIVEHRLDMVLPYVDKVWNIKSGEITKITDKKQFLESEIIINQCEASEYKDNAVLFDIRDVGFKVKDTEILKDISLKIYRGEKLLILGENGCGKTTLLRLISRLYKPTNGVIIQNLHPSFGMKKHNKSWFQKVGVVYQNPNYQLFMPTVEKEVGYNSVSEEYTQEIMKLLGIYHLKNIHPQSLSEGQKRRVTIAAVAASQPEVLILDEPSVGQDYKGLCELIQCLNDLHEKTGNTMISVTHDMRCAEAICNRAAIISNGIIKEIGGRELVRQFFFGKEM